MTATAVQATEGGKWLWCIRCERFVEQGELLEDWTGSRETCPYCYSSGIGIDLFEWDAWYRLYPRLLCHWPAAVTELCSGMQCSLRSAGRSGRCQSA